MSWITTASAADNLVVPEASSLTADALDNTQFHFKVLEIVQVCCFFLSCVIWGNCFYRHRTT